jgi:hypothetical protein
MEIKQVATILNTINREMTGEAAIVNEDLSNIVDIGKQLTADMTAEEIANYMENYTKKIIDKVGRTIIVDRAYKSTAPNIIRDSWEYGGIMEKIRVTVGDLEDDTTWGLTAGDTPEQFKYTPADLSAKYYDKYDTFMTQISIPEKTLRSAFNSSQDMNRLISAIENRVATKMAYSTDNLIRRTVNNMILECAKTNNRYVPLIGQFNIGRPQAEQLQPNQPEIAFKNADFLRFAVATINKYRRLFTELSTQYGGEGFVNFTPIENQKLILHADFIEGAMVNMESDTFNKELVKIKGDFDEVSYWQSPRDTTHIKGTPASGGEAITSFPAVVGILFDEDAAAVELEDNQVTSNYAANGRFYNYFHYANARYMNDMSENAIIFILA